jgi:PAS domain S-box-containing protein
MQRMLIQTAAARRYALVRNASEHTCNVDMNQATHAARLDECVMSGFDPSALLGQVAALSEQVTRLELAVQGANDGIWDWDIQTDAMYYSPRWKSMLGYNEHELPNRVDTWRERIHPDDRDYALTMLQAYLDGRMPFYELEHHLQHKDGTYRWVLARGTVLRDGNGTPLRIAGSHSDITRRKEAEAALERRDAILEVVRFAAECFLDPAQPWDASIQQVLARFGETMAADRVSIFENHHAPDGALLFSQRYAWVAPAITPQTDNPVLHRVTYHTLGFDRWAECLRQGQIVHGHVKDFPASEQVVLVAQRIQSLIVVPIMVEGRWWGWIGFDQCSTERTWLVTEMDALKAAASTLGAALQRQHAEAALRERETPFRTIFEQSGIGIALYGSGDIPLRTNAALQQMLGYSHEEFRELDMADFTHPDDLAVHAELQRLNSGAPRHHSTRLPSMMSVKSARKTATFTSVAWSDLLDGDRATPALAVADRLKGLVTRQLRHWFLLIDPAAACTLQVALEQDRDRTDHTKIAARRESSTHGFVLQRCR